MELKKPKKYKTRIYKGWHSPDNPPDLMPCHWRHERPFLVTSVSGEVYTAFYVRVEYVRDYEFIDNPSGEPRWLVSQRYSPMDERIIDIVAWTEFPESY